MSESVKTPARWVEISVSVDHEAVEPVVELFSQHGYNRGVAIEEPFIQDPDGDNLRVDLSRPVMVRTFIPQDVFDPALKEQIEQSLWYLGQLRPIGPLTIAVHQEEDWEHAWKQHFTPVRASRTVTIKPPWHDAPSDATEIVVTLDPGMAFGTGTHPTTRLCLELMEDCLQPGSSMLDAGTGTGVLAIAARLMGASSVDAVDIDTVAVRQAQRNLELNPQADRITIWQDSLERSPASAPYDFVVANIISRILVDIHHSLIASLQARGLLLLGGIIDAKEDQVVECYRSAGLELAERRQMGDWIAQVWRHPAGSLEPGRAPGSW